ncbi:MAG: glycosyltransferase [Actinomycetota bacterium]
MLVIHSNPTAEPGVGDAGGMTVYVRELARTLAASGLEVDIYSRREATAASEEVFLCPGVRVSSIRAGAESLSKEELPAHLPEFTANVAALVEGEGRSYDVIHSHYWLSGRVASTLASRWGIPFVHTFHTLGRVKNEGLRSGDVAEPEARLFGEARVIAEADAIVAATCEERRWLIDLYAAHPERIHVVAPGVNHRMFRPGDREQAKARLGVSGRQVLLFVGRLQPLKGADTAIEALAHLVEWGRLSRERVMLMIVGGGSGMVGAGEPERLRSRASALKVSDLVRLVPAQPHARLPAFYQAADVCLVPSHTESFGLVALEAQACGIPVVASAVGGLASIVRHGRTGFLVEPGSSAAFAERAWRILSDAPLASSLGRLAICSSGDFSWERSGAELSELYSASARVSLKAGA